jgi:hypothetical protein
MPASINAAQAVNNVPETSARAARKDWGKTGVSSLSMRHSLKLIGIFIGKRQAKLVAFDTSKQGKRAMVSLDRD